MSQLVIWNNVCNVIITLVLTNLVSILIQVLSGWIYTSLTIIKLTKLKFKPSGCLVLRTVWLESSN